MLFHTKVDISKNKSLTPEGFLICKNVAISRIGDQTYYEGEVPITADGNGAIIITRDAEEVFNAEAIASFEGKPITMHHPEDAVTPDNWAELSKGHAQNVRRGSGLESDSLYADLLIMEKQTIDDVMTGKIKEISCGYDADYTETGAGKGKQTNIRGNHIALVDHGRCGMSCMIHDANTGNYEVTYVNREYEKVKKVFKNDPKGPPENALTAAKEYAKKLEKSDAAKEYGDIRGSVVVSPVNDAIHDGSSDNPGTALLQIIGEARGIQLKFLSHKGMTIEQARKLTKTQQEQLQKEYTEWLKSEEKTKDDSKKIQDEGKGGSMKEKLRAFFKSLTSDEVKDLGLVRDAELTIDQRIDRLQKTVDTLSKMLKDAEEESEEEKKKKKETEDAEEEEEAAKKKKETEDTEEEEKEFGKSKDSYPMLQEVLYRSSILAPDLSRPTMDSIKSMKKKTFDESICLLKRKSLDAAYQTEDGKSAITPFLMGKSADFLTMDCKVLDVAFIGASEVMKKTGSQYQAKYQTSDMMRGAVSVASINDANKKFWDNRKGGK